MQHENIKVSVLTPIYNHSIEYVKQCLDSLKAQTLQEIEFILLDNGAPEDVKQLIEEYIALDNRFKAIHFEQNVGYSKAMNTGINNAKGKYIGIVESDDYVNPQMYYQLFDIAVTTKADIIKCLYSKVINGKDKRYINFYPENIFEKLLTNRLDYQKIISSHPSIWTFIYKRDFLIKNEIYFEENPLGGLPDVGFIYKCWLNSNSFYFFKSYLYHYRFDNQNSTIANYNTSFKNILYELISLTKYLETKAFNTDDLNIVIGFAYIRLYTAFKYNFCYKNLKSWEFLRLLKHILIRLVKISEIKTLDRQYKDKVLLCIKHPNLYYLMIYNEYLKEIKYPQVKSKIKNFILKKTSPSNGLKKMYILGLPIYYRKTYKNYVKRDYVFSFLQIRESKYISKYYICKIPIFNKIKIIDAVQQLTTNLHKINCETKTLIQCQSLHKETFGPYKYAFKDKTVVLIASGPTAQYHLPIENAIYVGVNNACLLENVKLDFLFCQDFYMDEEKRNAIVNYRPNECQKFFGRIPDERIKQCWKHAAGKHVKRCPKYLIEQSKAKEYYVYDNIKLGFCLDIENEPLMAGGIAFAAMQFILHTHPQKIYLVGCDCSKGFFYKSDIVFDNTNMLAGWIALKAHIDELYPDIEIVSINPVGLRGLFKDEYSDNYLESFDEKERAALNV